MTANPTLPITYGTVSGSPITGNVNSATLASLVYVTISATPYVRSPPPGYPRPNAGAAIATSLTAFPQTIPNGTRLQLFSDEASALVAANAASFSAGDDVTTRKYFAGAIVKDAGLGPREVKVICSTGTKDRAGDVVEPSGCEMRGYLKNNIVLANHDRSSPVGTAAPAIVNNHIEAKITFAPAGISRQADEWCGLAKTGVVNGVSIGFNPIEYEPLRGGSGTRFTKWELLEISLVAVPANVEAVVVERSFPGKTNIVDDCVREIAARGLVTEALKLLRANEPTPTVDPAARRKAKLDRLDRANVGAVPIAQPRGVGGAFATQQVLAAEVARLRSAGWLQ